MLWKQEVTEQEMLLSQEPPVPSQLLQQVACPLCDASFRDRSEIVSHLNLHYPPESRICPVLECSQAFGHPNSVRNHMRQKHLAQWNRMKLLKSHTYAFMG